MWRKDKMRYVLQIEKKENQYKEHFEDVFLNAFGKEFNIDNEKISNEGESTSYQLFRHITDNISEYCRSNQKYHITTDGHLFRIEENQFPQGVELYQRHIIEKDLYNYFIGEFNMVIKRAEAVQNEEG